MIMDMTVLSVSPAVPCLSLSVSVRLCSPWLHSLYTPAHHQQSAHLSAVEQSAPPTRALDELSVVTGSQLDSHFVFVPCVLLRICFILCHSIVCLPAGLWGLHLCCQSQDYLPACLSIHQASTWIPSASPQPATSLCSCQHSEQKTCFTLRLCPVSAFRFSLIQSWHCNIKKKLAIQTDLVQSNSLFLFSFLTAHSPDLVGEGKFALN